MVICQVTQQKVAKAAALQGQYIKAEIYDLIKHDFPDFDTSKYVSITALNKYRRAYFAQLIQQDKSDLASLDADVLQAIKSNSILSDKIDDTSEISSSWGDKIADKVANFGGSWTFIISFFAILISWMILNIVFLKAKAFDPYPFILLNLILSCVAAIQAPIIMMSQNRQETKDRLRAENDYKVNLKAELEIQLLNEKIDHLLVHQNQILLNIQEVQLNYLEDLDERLVSHLNNKKP